MKHAVLIRNVDVLLREHGVAPSAGPMLCGLSGGADSVALVLVLKELGYDVVALHCNFQLRGDESSRDERFVRDFCQRHAIPLHAVCFDTRAEAARTGESIEMAARRLRYDWFQKILEDSLYEVPSSPPRSASRKGDACNKQERGSAFGNKSEASSRRGRGGRQGALCVAHHADDNVETMLLNLIRGAGLQGLAGMDFCNDRGVLRPLLTSSRKDIEAYLEERGQTFVVDSTNRDTLYRRNKIRHELLPLLRTMNPSIDRTLTATMAYLREAATLLDSVEEGRVFQQRRQLVKLGFTMTQITQMEQARNGAYTTAGDYVLTKHADRLLWAPMPPRVAPTPVASHRRRLAPGEDLRRTDVAILDASAVVGQLFVRSTMEGDRFRPYGMRGTKLVSDYLTDRHRSRIDKLAALVVCDDAGILWLVGETIAHRAAVTAATTEVVEVRRLEG